MLEKLRQVCLAFRIADDLVSYEELKTGNINRTYKVNTVKSDGSLKSYIVQEVNTYVFKNPVWVMENIDRVTEHNLVRARCQIALAKDMLAKMDEMERIVAECMKKYV